MSIITEALKKAGQEKGVLASSVLLPKKKHSFNWGPVFVILVLVLITGPIIAPLFSNPFSKENFVRQETSAVSPPASSAPNDTANRKPQFAVEELPLMQAANPSPFVPAPYLRLSGVVYSKTDISYCIINNKVVRVGETIQDARIVSITPDRVILDYKGQRINLDSEI